MNTLHQPPQTRSTGTFSQRGRSQVALIGAEVVWSKLDGISPISNTRPVCVPCRRANWRTGSCGSVAGHHASRGGKARSYGAVPLSRQLACTLAGLQGTRGWRCEECGIAQGTEQISRHTGTFYRVALHAAHPDHDPVNPCPRLKAMCPRCHGRYDFRCGERRRWLALDMLKHRLFLPRQQKGVAG